MIQKPGTPSSMPSKSVIFGWIKQIVPEASTKMKVEDLGDGVIYCKIINHYFPGSVNLNRLNLNPKNEYEYSLNLKLFQNALTLHKVTVPFDVAKISKQKFLQNWGLINALYRQMSSNNDESVLGEDSKSISLAGSKFTPKRSFESTFSNQQTHKLPQVQSFKPTYTYQNLQGPVVHYQNNQNFQQPVQQTVQPTKVAPISNQLFPNPSTIQTASITSNAQNQGNVAPQNSIYSQSTMNQMNFGALNFGMGVSNSLINSNFNNSMNLQFNRPQQISGRESNLSQLSKGNIFEQQTSNKCWSVGKLPTRESFGLFNLPPSQNSGKYSVNSHIFQNNYNAVIDRVKEILLKNSHDIEKIRQIKMLLNIPLNEDIVKIQEEENVMMNCTNISKNTENIKLEKNSKNTENEICTKQTIEGSKENIDISEISSIKQNSNASQRVNPSSKSISNSGSVIELSGKKVEKLQLGVKPPQNSAKKIKNNFFAEGNPFRR